MELVLARVTRQLGQGAVDHVDDSVANRTLLHALKHLVHILLPEHHRIEERPVLVVQQGAHGQHPPAPLALAYTDAPRALHLDRPRGYNGFRVWGLGRR